MTKNIIITGATGFIGRALCRFLQMKGFAPIALSRNIDVAQKVLPAGVRSLKWDGASGTGWQAIMEDACGVINLAGANVAARRWTQKRKAAILESRLQAGRAVTQAILTAKKKPAVMIQASAIGFYGATGEDGVDENGPKGTGFLSDVVMQWEASVDLIKQTETRLVTTRFGVVLGDQGGALRKMLTPFRLFAGGPPGGGRQWLSWVHMDDLLHAVLFLLDKKNLTGVFNITSPNPVSMRLFCSALGKVLHRPSWLPIPKPVLLCLFGRMAQETILASQRVLPGRLRENGFTFQYPDILPALQSFNL